MWRNPNPKYAGQLPGPDPADAPRDEDRLLAVLPRAKGEELHVSIGEFNGFEFVSLRVWGPGSDGRLWPLKGKGCTIKLKEIVSVARALAEALKQTGQGQNAAQLAPPRDAERRTTQGGGPPRGQDGRRTWHGSSLPGITDGRSGDEFDEFGA